MEVFTAYLRPVILADIVLALLTSAILFDANRRDMGENYLMTLFGGLEIMAGMGFAYLFSCSFVVLTPVAIFASIWLAIFK